MLPRTAVAALAPSSLLVSASLLWGCTGSSPGNDPTIRRHFDILADQIAELQGDLETTRETLNSLAAQTQPGGARGAAPSAEIATLQASDQEIQRSIAELRQQLAQISTRLDQSRSGSTVTASNTRPAEPPRTAPVAAERPAAAETAQTAPPPEAAAQAAESAPPTESRPQVSRVRGFYHTYSDQESLAAIASRYHIDVPTLLEANALPPNVRLLPGQQLFIPQGS